MMRDWLARHAAMFELLAVLDGSPPGSVDAHWISLQCQEYPNVRYGNEKEWLNGSVTDRGLRDAATRILLDPGQTVRRKLTGRWIMNAHPDEWYVQDVRELAAAIDSCCPGLNFVRCDQLYAMPAPSERFGIMSHTTEPNGFTTFHPVNHLTTADRSYSFRNEVCLFKWTSSAKGAWAPAPPHWACINRTYAPAVHQSRRPPPVNHCTCAHSTCISKCMTSAVVRSRWRRAGYDSPRQVWVLGFSSTRRMATGE